MFIEKEKAQQRFNVCKQCPNMSSLYFCKSCGCYMKFKVKLQTSQCPENKWDN